MPWMKRSDDCARCTAPPPSDCLQAGPSPPFGNPVAHRRLLPTARPGVAGRPSSQSTSANVSRKPSSLRPPAAPEIRLHPGPPPTGDQHLALLPEIAAQRSSGMTPWKWSR